MITMKGGSWLLLMLIFCGCKKAVDDTNSTQPENDNKKIISFTLTKPDGSAFDATTFSVIIAKDSVHITVPPLSDRGLLKASVEFKGKSIYPENGAMLDFTAPVHYKITGDDGSSKSYVVQAKIAQAKNAVFVGTSDNNFYAFDAETGVIRWSYKANGSFAYSSPTYKDGVVFVGCIDNNVYAFNAINGKTLWKFNTGGSTGIESDAVVVDSTVYVGCNDDKFFAINAVTGALRWTYETSGNISSCPSVKDGVVYFGCSDAYVYALNIDNGSLKWKFKTNGMINQSGVCLYNNTLYVGSRDGNLYAINAATGVLKWAMNTGISLEMSSPVVYERNVYIGGWYATSFNKKGSLYAVNADNGSLVWESLPNTGFSSDPSVDENKVFITGDDGNISAVNAKSGLVLWQRRILANSGSPFAANGVVYVGGGGTGYMYAFNALTGSEVWKSAIPNALMTSRPLVIK